MKGERTGKFERLIRNFDCFYQKLSEVFDTGLARLRRT